MSDNNAPAPEPVTSQERMFLAAVTAAQTTIVEAIKADHEVAMGRLALDVDRHTFKVRRYDESK